MARVERETGAGSPAAWRTWEAVERMVGGWVEEEEEEEGKR